jgi:hypothetical protein
MKRRGQRGRVAEGREEEEKRERGKRRRLTRSITGLSVIGGVIAEPSCTFHTIIFPDISPDANLSTYLHSLN